MSNMSRGVQRTSTLNQVASSGLVRTLRRHLEKRKPQLHLPLVAVSVHPKDDGWTLHAGLGVEWCYPAPSGLIWAS